MSNKTPQAGIFNENERHMHFLEYCINSDNINQLKQAIAQVVQDNQSLENFLTHVQYQFWVENQSPSTTSNAIRSMISKVLGADLPQFDRIAERLGMSSSTLRRRLMEEDTSYQKIKDDCRKSMAIDYLHQYDYKIHEIGDLLGFAETSSFVRSFKKWTGMTPKAYRDSSRAFSSSSNSSTS